MIERTNMRNPLESDGTSFLNNDLSSFSSANSTPSIKLYSVSEGGIVNDLPQGFDGILVNINTRVINDQDESSTPDHIDGQTISGNWLTIALRKLDFCDADGNKKSILVFASQPFDE